MFLRGEFRRQDGLVIPNNVTNVGRAAYLRFVFNGVDTGVPILAGGNFYIGLCNTIPFDAMTLADIAEPTEGLNGYDRIAVTRNNAGFPNTGTVNGEPFIETADIVFTATDVGFDSAISRLFLTPIITGAVGDLYALSEAIETPLTILTSTPVGQRTFRYRTYFR